MKLVHRFENSSQELANQGKKGWALLDKVIWMTWTTIQHHAMLWLWLDWQVKSQLHMLRMLLAQSFVKRCGQL